jgi:hypothetical protein
MNPIVLVVVIPLLLVWYCHMLVWWPFCLNDSSLLVLGLLTGVAAVGVGGGAQCIHFKAPLLLTAALLIYQKELQVRVCQDRDCLTGGGKEAPLSILEDLSQGSQAEVISCGCIGPCGSGPNVAEVQDGVRVKDSR